MDRLHIAFFGPTNSGKSTLVNALAGQQVSLVSPIPGTTTDPVRKVIELPGLGPCVLIDTAGLGDASALGAERVRLTQIEYSIMKYFMDNPGKALSQEDILNEVWGRDYFGELKIVDVNIRRLRIKIEDDPTMPAYITTVWGYGYKWGF